MARKRNTMNVLLVSTSGSNYSYTKKRTTKGEKASKKLQLKKFDRRKRAHFVFVEKKLVFKAN